MTVKSFVFAGLALPLLIPATAFAQNAPPACLAGREAVWLGGAEVAELSGAALQSEVSTGSGGSLLAAFRVTGDERPLRIELGNHSQGDPHLTLYTASGTMITEMDDYEGTLASRIEHNLAPGDYCALARDVSNGPLTATLRVSEMSDTPIVTAQGRASMAACTAATEAVTLDDAALAKALGDYTFLSETFSADQGPKYLRFNLPGNAGLRLTATSSQADPVITLYNAAGEQVAENDDADGTNARLDLLGNLAAGTYCLGATSIGGGSGEIRVSVGGVDPAEVLRDAYRQGQIPPPSSANYPVEALDLTSAEPQVKLLGGSALWFSFDIEERQVVILNAYAAATGMDTRMALFDVSGRQITENDDANGSTDPQIGPVLLEPGSYRLALVQLGADSTTGQMRAASLSAQRYLRAK
ncbi:hypothetical protein [Falsigemmobacter faecalis]|uniref:ABC transporter substrate-binding protein n=1 Tax=Falsigemmobacter faecalis TaxID=2488730 RepID=A0A3P3DVE0_9RHOB|nr:hypothetical protein [Falsigemmobacter faecalis]RRH78243.1 hypothetical protein EG244_02020 [Falsigemmobacter faecalis]